VGGGGGHRPKGNMRETINSYKILVGKPEVKKLFVISRRNLTSVHDDISNGASVAVTSQAARVRHVVMRNCTKLKKYEIEMVSNDITFE
jgi:hypothetical protein